MRRFLRSRAVFLAALVLGVSGFLGTAFSWTNYVLENGDLCKLSARFFGPGQDEEEGLKELLHFVATECNHPVDASRAGWMAKLEERLPLKLSPLTVLHEGYAFPGTKRFGPCGSLSRLIRAVARCQGMKVRMVMLEGDKAGGEHKMVAVWLDGGYRLLDPTFDHYWVNEKGRIATIEEVRDNPRIFAQVFTKHPDYPYRLVDPLYFRWSRLGPLEKPAKAVASVFVGEKGLSEVDTPEWIERPWYGYGWVCLIFSLPFLMLAWVARPRSRRIE